MFSNIICKTWYQSNDNIIYFRLQTLESGIVGGEQVFNSEIRENISRKKQHAEERKLRLAEANAALEDEGIMVGIYETIQDELRLKNKLLQKQKQKVVNMMQIFFETVLYGTTFIE